MTLKEIQREKLKAKIKKAPTKPGVYFWQDKDKNILYVGRSFNLRSRLKQYLPSNLEKRIAEMMSLAQDFNYQETDTLLEAIILEAQEIKKNWPKYNVKDKDDRSFIYIVIPKKDFSYPLIIRGQNLKKFSAGKAHIFGPYQSYTLIKRALRLIRHLFPYSTCSPSAGRACFDYQIGLCPGVCLQKISARDYQKNIKNIILLLSGEKKRLLKKLIQNDPEKAKYLQHLQEVSLLQNENNLQMRKVKRLEAYDISHHSGQESYGAMSVMIEGELAKSSYRLFKIKKAPSGDDEKALLEVLKRRFKHSDWPFPDIIIIDGGNPQISFLKKNLVKLNIAIPLIGISKYGGDRLIFSRALKNEYRLLAENIKEDLLKLREEAHRFANQGRKNAFLKRKKKTA